MHASAAVVCKTLELLLQGFKGLGFRGLGV